MKQLLIFLLLVLTPFAFTQVIGGHDNSNLIPSSAKASPLSAGNIAGDVNVFTGDYNTSVPLGSVSTPGGLNYALSLNYSTTYTAGTSPMVASGIPYGEGWDVNIPTISISNAAYFSFLQTYECLHNNQTTPDSTNYYDRPTAEKNGDIYWFSPIVNIPGYANGKAVFKYIDADDYDCAVFVLNSFDKYVELRFYGSKWRVFIDNGDIYEFDVALKTYRSPNNQRLLNYNTYDQQSDNETHDKIKDNSYGAKSQAIRNVLEPKTTFTAWYCSKLSNKNQPNQTISFNYQKFGQFNYFKAYEQYYIQSALNTEFPNNLFPSLNGFLIPNDFNIYTDILLESVASYDALSPIDVLELDYETSDLYSTNMLHPDMIGVHRKDSLYNYKTILSEGINGDFSSDWNRYLHGKTSDIPTASPRQISAYNPYIVAGNNYLRQTNVGGNAIIPFNHGFLESQRIGANQLISGDTYEIRTKVIDANGSSSTMGNGTIDIAVVTGDMNVNISQPNLVPSYNSLNGNNPGNQYPLSSYNSTRGEQVYSTFDNSIKWHMSSTATSVHTSNVFVMPNIPYSNQGVNIQIGPGNSDHKYDKSPYDNTGAPLLITTGSSPEVTAYNAYAHMEPDYLQASGRIPSNFGIGMPWAMTLPIYAAGMDGTNLSSPKESGYNKFWWNDNTNNAHTWDNEPTKLNDKVKLQEFELIRYSKNPYMLKHAKVYKTNGVISPDDQSGKVLVSELELDYDLDAENLYENYDYSLHIADQNTSTTQQNNIIGDSLVLSNFHKQYIYTLTAVKSVPTGEYNTGTHSVDNYQNSELLQTEFEYDVYGGATRNAAELGLDLIINPGRSTRILTKIIDQLGGETDIEYYPRSSLATLTGSYGLSSNSACGESLYNKSSYASNRAEIVHPSVKKIIRNKDLLAPMGHTIGNAPMHKETEYIYDTLNIIYETKDLKLPSNFRKSFKYSYNKGFLTTTVLQPELESGERNKTIFYHHGNVYQPTIVNNQFIDDPSTIEEYLYYGKMDKIENYDSNDELESSTEFIYDYTLAYKNGYERPLSNRDNLISSFDFSANSSGGSTAYKNYEYKDYYQNNSENKNTVNWSYLSDRWVPLSTEKNTSSGERARLVDIYFYNDLQAINPEFKFHSYFVKLKSKSTKTYDETCSKSAQIVNSADALQDYEVAVDPFGDTPTNPNPNNPNVDDGLIDLISASGNGLDILDTLIDESPLSNAVLDAYINKMHRFDANVSYNILKVQNPIRKEALNSIFDRSNRMSPEQVIEIFESQPFLMDYTQSHIIAHHESSQNEILVALLNHNTELSDVILSQLIEASEFPEAARYDILLNQPQLNINALQNLSSTQSQVGGYNIARILNVQPLLPDAIYNNVLNNNSISNKHKVQVLSQSASYPSDALLVAKLSNFSTRDVKKILLACPRPFGTNLHNLGKSLVSRQDWQEIQLAQGDLNPYDLYCANNTTCARGFIESKEDYSYYEADYKGETLAEGYKKLMGLEDVVGKIVPASQSGLAQNITLQNIQLKHEPSWQLFSKKSYSPEYPGAYSEQEYFYYFDELNRRDRHIQYYDLVNNKATLLVDTSLPLDTAITLSNHSVFYADAGLGGEIPLPDGARNAQANNLRQVAFQATTFTKNNTDIEPLMQSQYYYYESKWKSPELFTESTINYSGPSCPPSAPSSGDCSQSIVAWVHGSGISNNTIQTNTPNGYCAYRFDPPFGPIIYLPQGSDVTDCENTSYQYSYEAVGCNDGSTTGDNIADPKYVAVYQPVWHQYMFLKNVAIQIDTLANASTDWDARLDHSNEYIAHFYVGADDTSNLSENKMIYPFDTLGIRTIDQINRYGQVALEHNQSHLFTKYHYDMPEKNWYANTNNNANCPNYGAYGQIVSTNIGVPTAVTVGYK